MSKKKTSWTKFLWGGEDEEEDDIASYYKPTYGYGFNRPIFSPAEKEKNARKDMEAAAKKGDFLGAIKALSRMRKVKDEKTQESDAEKERQATMKEFNETGVWKGYNYYTAPRVDSRYIEQIANALAARYKIDVNPGDAWKVDIKAKKLTYDPDTLLTSTKGRMLASLLHEIGHIRHTTPSSDLHSDYLTKYDTKAQHVINLFEDLRIDTIMSRSYGSAEDIYAENKPIVRAIAEGYAEKSQYIRDTITNEIIKQFDNIFVEAEIKVDRVDGSKRIVVRDAIVKLAGNDKKDIEKVKRQRKQVFGSEEIDDEFKAKVKTLFEGLINMDTLEDYSAGILLLGYGEELPPALQPKMQARIDMTKHAIPFVKVKKSTQEMTDLLNTDVYPVIEDLLKQQEELENMLKPIFGEMAREIAERAIQESQRGSKGTKAEGDPKKVEPRETKRSGRGDNVPPEWREGNYDVLAESVKFEVQRLVQRLKLLKKQEDIVRYSADHKRGRLSTKQLHRFASGNMRLFKKKEETPKTVDAHAFSVVIDSSGSMYTNPITHATRAAVLFAEVFSQMDIPFEVIAFDTSAKVLKPLNKPLDKKNKDMLAGLPARDGGGSTNLYTAMKVTKIAKSEKANKMMIILSDGGIGDFEYYNEDKRMMAAANVKLFGVSIDSGPDIVEFCGSGIEVKKLRLLPDEFSKIIRGTFKGGKHKNF